MKYVKNFNKKLIKKGGKLRLLKYDDPFNYFTIGDFHPKLGWEIIPKGYGGHRYKGDLMYLDLSDFPGNYELLME